MPPTPQLLELIHEVFKSFSSDLKTIHQSNVRGLLSALGITVTNQEVADLGKKMHISEHDRITFDMFISTLDKTIETVQQIDVFDDTFSCFDRNNDEKITLPDLRALTRDMGLSIADSDLEVMLKAGLLGSAEASDTGELSLNKEQFRQLVKKMDTNPEGSKIGAGASDKSSQSRVTSVKSTTSQRQASLSLKVKKKKKKKKSAASSSSSSSNSSASSNKGASRSKESTSQRNVASQDFSSKKNEK